MTSAEFEIIVEAYLLANDHLSPATVENVRNTVASLSSYANGRDIDATRVKGWTTNQMLRQAAVSSVYLRRSIIKSLVAWAIEHGHTKQQVVEPFRGLPKAPKEALHDRCINAAEYRRLLACKFLPQDNWFPDILRTAWETGIRLSDAVHLQWESVDIETRSIKLQPRKTAGDSKWIHVPISDELTEIFRNKLARCERMNPTVWPEALFEWECRGGRKVLVKKFKRYARQAGIPAGKGFHGLRHARITSLLEAGGDTAMVRSFTGHSLAVLERYAGHVSLEAKRQAFERTRQHMKANV